jgi:hypothetical protein
MEWSPKGMTNVSGSSKVPRGVQTLQLLCLAHIGVPPCRVVGFAKEIRKFIGAIDTDMI